MTSRPNRSSQQQQPPPPGTGAARQNEYFVPRDGIDREVITADICRYLGNDALVRPGTYESPDGRVTQGYFITAYRNLTTAMIQDLKADSARWEQERRSTSRSGGGSAGAPSSRDPPRYHTSETHHNRQYYGPTSGDASGGYSDPMAIDSYSNPPPQQATPRYPGTGNAGYYGVSSNAGQDPQYGSQPGYGSAVGAQSGYSGGYGGAPYQTTDRFGSTAPAVPTDQSANAYVTTGANYVPTASANDYAAANRMAPAVVAAPSRNPGYGQAQAGYGQDTSGFYSAAPSNYSQPIDAFYGRGQGGANTTTGYSTLPDATQQFTGTPQASSTSSRTPVPSSSSTDAQMTNSGPTMGSSSSRRDGDRDTRERTERSHRDRGDRDRDRDDRHANERREHRQHRHR